VKPLAKAKAQVKRPKGAVAPKAEDVLTAALQVSQRLEIEGQLSAFLDVARSWAAAADGVAFGPDLEGARLAALVTTLTAEDERLESLRRAVRSRGAADWADGAFPLAADGVRALAVPLRGDDVQGGQAAA